VQSDQEKTSRILESDRALVVSLLDSGRLSSELSDLIVELKGNIAAKGEVLTDDEREWLESLAEKFDLHIPTRKPKTALYIPKGEQGSTPEVLSPSMLANALRNKPKLGGHRW
jgi:hypothetical protein